MSVKFKCVPFADLTVYELYEIMALRQEIFAVEQNCVYQDADGKDLDGWHVLGVDTDLSRDGREGVLVAYTRLLPQGSAYDKYASIGRVACSSKVRGLGYGKILMTETLAHMKKIFLNDPIKIGAQCYLIKFYESFGFKSVGEPYIEDGIPHISMILKIV